MGSLVFLQSDRLDHVSAAQNLSLAGKLNNALVDLLRGERCLALVSGLLIEGLIDLLREGVPATRAPGSERLPDRPPRAAPGAA